MELPVHALVTTVTIARQTSQPWAQIPSSPERKTDGLLAVSARIEKLEQDGFIKGYHTDLDMEKLGYGIKALL